MANIHSGEDNRRENALISTVYPISCIHYSRGEQAPIGGHTSFAAQSDMKIYSA